MSQYIYELLQSLPGGGGGRREGFSIAIPTFILPKIIRILWYWLYHKLYEPLSFQAKNAFKHWLWMRRNTCTLKIITASKPYTTQKGNDSVLALIKKETKFSSYIRKFRWDQLQSHIWGRSSWYMRRPLVIYAFATDPFWISLFVLYYIRKIVFPFFIS